MDIPCGVNDCGDQLWVLCELSATARAFLVSVDNALLCGYSDQSAGIILLL